MNTSVRPEVRRVARSFDELEAVTAQFARRSFRCDHKDAVWNEVDKVMPDYRERKEWLRLRRAEMDL